MDFAEAKAQFLNSCRARGLSPHTLRAYASDLGDFGVWLAKSDDEEPTRVTIVGWLESLRLRELAATSIRRRLACLKVMFRWMEVNDLIMNNPFHKFRETVSVPKRLPRNIPVNELKQLLDHRPIHGNIAHFTLLLSIELLVTTGLRVGELCSIRLSDIDLVTETIAIRGKGNRERRVFIIDNVMKERIARYLRARDVLGPATDNFLVTGRGTRATPDFIRQRLHRHAKAQKLQRRVTPHMFRHSAATQLLECGVDIRFVQKLLGHASISTTEIYTHVADSSLRRAITSADFRRSLE